jgi:hypothetical protein
MTFEEKIREERNAIGMSISGDPLDGLKRYIEKKSLGLDKVKEFITLLEENITEEALISDEIDDSGEIPLKEEKEDEDTPLEEKEERKERKEKPVVQVIGYVENIRKIITKK